jgi:hypothetical protein
MSKRKSRMENKRALLQGGKRRSIFAVSLLVSLLVTGAVLAQMGGVFSAKKTGGEVTANSLLERQAGSGSFVQLTTPPATGRGYKDSTVTHGTTYQYRVKAVNGGLSSAYSNIITVTP